jgi:hypothetical protein
MGVVLYPYNLSTWDTEAEDQEFEASLGYTARPYLKQTKWQKTA